MALLPTLMTLGNGVCGVVAIFKVGMWLVEPDPHKTLFLHQAAWWILGGMVFDALDGLVARLTHTASNFGAQLDSLCDLVTFGVAPAFLVFAQSYRLVEPGFMRDRLVPAVCGLYAICALIRLARFTVETAPDESAHREFAGLPSPAAAGVIAAAFLPPREFANFGPLLVAVLPGLTLATGILMVSRIRYAHVINRHLRGRRPFVTLLEIALVVALAAIFKEFAFFIAFFGYAVTGPITWLKRRLSRKPSLVVPVPSVHAERDESLF